MRSLLRRFAQVAVAGVLAVVAGSYAAGADHAYVGAKKCKMCHLKEYNSWAETKMAKVFELLKPGAGAEARTKAKLDPTKDYTTDTLCLPCHTTGYGKPGGYVDQATTPDMVGVGCEMCHGPGGTYTQKEHMSLQNKEYKRAALVAVGLVHPVSKTTCEQCHNPKSPFFQPFVFEERVTKGTHEKFALKYPH